MESSGNRCIGWSGIRNWCGRAFDNKGMENLEKPKSITFAAFFGVIALVSLVIASLALWILHSSEFAVGILSGGLVAGFDFTITAWCIRQWFQSLNTSIPISTVVLFTGKFFISVAFIYLLVRYGSVHWIGLITGITVALIVMIVSGIYWIRRERERATDE